MCMIQNDTLVCLRCGLFYVWFGGSCKITVKQRFIEVYLRCGLLQMF
jgi:hypothetical protein